MTSNGVTVGMRQCLLSVGSKDKDNPLVREVAMDPIAAATSLAWKGSMGEMMRGKSEGPRKYVNK